MSHPLALITNVLVIGTNQPIESTNQSSIETRRTIQCLDGDSDFCSHHRRTWILSSAERQWFRNSRSRSINATISHGRLRKAWSTCSIASRVRVTPTRKSRASLRSHRVEITISSIPFINNPQSTTHNPFDHSFNSRVSVLQFVGLGWIGLG